jgi:molybdate transport system substrate-binding protein
MAALKILCSIGARPVLTDIAPAFEKQHGVTFAASYGPSNALIPRAEAGEAADVAIMTDEAIEGLMRKGIIAAGSRVDIARSGVGVAVRRGAPRPDISSAEAFKRTLLSARAIAHSKTGASGIYFAGLIQKLGLAEVLKDKLIVRDGIVGEIAASGEAEIAIQQVGELMQASGIDIVGPLPDELQTITVFSAGVFAKAENAGVAKALTAYLVSKDVVPVLRARGLEAM